MTAPAQGQVDGLADAVAELVQLQAAQAELADREKYVKTQIRRMLPERGTYPVGDLEVSVQANRRFDPKKAAELIADDNVRALVSVTKTEVDRKKCEAMLPDIFDQAHTVGDDRVVIR